MPVLNPRSRLISLRLTDDEYQALIRITRAEGARSTSELARNAICSFLTRCDSPARETETPERISQIEAELKRLKRVLETMATLAREQA